MRCCNKRWEKKKKQCEFQEVKVFFFVCVKEMYTGKAYIKFLQTTIADN